MKTKFFSYVLSLIMMMFVFSSCGDKDKDDDNKGNNTSDVTDVTSAKQIVGTWGNEDLIFSFESNGTGYFYVKETGNTTDFKYTVSLNGTMKLEFKKNDPEDYSVYIKNEKLYMVDFYGYGFVFDKMADEFPLAGSWGISDDGGTASPHGKDLTYKFEKDGAMTKTMEYKYESGRSQTIIWSGSYILNGDKLTILFEKGTNDGEPFSLSEGELEENYDIVKIEENKIQLKYGNCLNCEPFYWYSK